MEAGRRNHAENIIQIDQNLLGDPRLDRLVAEKVAELLNAMLDAEADEIANAAKYEAPGERKAYRAGHLPTEPPQGRQARVEGAQTGRGLRVRGHRTIPETRGECPLIDMYTPA